MKTLKELTGTRVLYKIAGSMTVNEGKVREFSPSGKYVQMGWDNGWHEATAISVVEELPPTAAMVAANSEPAVTSPAQTPAPQEPPAPPVEPPKAPATEAPAQ